MTDDTLATLLLCAHQGGEDKVQPLSVSDYNRVAAVLYQSHLRPQYLLMQGSVGEISNHSGISQDRLEWLLDRRINLGFKLEQWQRSGIWVLSRSDPIYPIELRRCLRNLAPPLIFGTGNQDLLTTGGTAVIGPDSIPTSRIQISCGIAKNILEHNKTVILAGHLKMSREIVGSVHRQTAKIIWVLHEGCLKQRLEKSRRLAIRNNHLVLVTPQSPDAPKESGEKGLVGMIATALATDLLYVDGTNSRNQSKRADQYEVRRSVMKRPEICTLLAGRALTPEGESLKERGIPLWTSDE